MEGLILEMSLEKICETNKKVIIRDGIEIFMPTELGRNFSKSFILAHGKCWWPKINKEIEKIYSHCKPCRTKEIAKLHKPVEIRPIFLDSLAPGQVIHLDCLEYDSKSYSF